MYSLDIWEKKTDTLRARNQQAVAALIESDAYSKLYTEINRATEEYPATRQHLADVSGMSDRGIRKAVEAFRRAGVRVLATSGGKGYRMCRSEEDYKQLRAEYKAREASMRETVEAMDAGCEGQIMMSFTG